MGVSLSAAASQAVRSLENPPPESTERVEAMSPLDARLALLDEKVGLYVERFGVTEGELGSLHKRIRAARKGGLENKTKVADEAERLLASTQFETKIETDAKDPLLKEKVETAFSLIQHVRKHTQEKLETIGIERAGEFVTDAKLLAAVKKDPTVWQSIKLRAAEGSSVAKAFADPAVRLDTPEGRAAYAEATGQDAQKVWGWVKEHKVATAAIVLGGIALVSWFMDMKKDPASDGKKEIPTMTWTAGLAAVGLGLAAWQMDRVESGVKTAKDLAAAGQAKLGLAGEAVKGVMAKGKDMVTEAQNLAGKGAPRENAKDEFDQHTNVFAEKILSNPVQGREGEFQYRLVRSIIKGGGFTQAQKDFEAMAVRLESGQKLSSEDMRQLSGYTQGKWWIEQVGHGALTIASAGGYFVYRIAKEELHFISNTVNWVMGGFAAKEGADLWEQYRDVGMYVMGATTLKEILLGNPHAGTTKRILEAGKKLRYGAAWPIYAYSLVNQGIQATGINMSAAAEWVKTTKLGSVKMVNGALEFVNATGQYIAKLTLKKGVEAGVLQIWEGGKWVVRSLAGKETAVAAEALGESTARTTWRRELAKRVVGDGAKKFFTAAAEKLGVKAAAEFVAKRAVAAGISNTVPFAGQVASVGIAVWTVADVGMMGWDFYHNKKTQRLLAEREGAPESAVWFDAATEAQLAGLTHDEQMAALAKLPHATMCIERVGWQDIEEYKFENGKMTNVALVAQSKISRPVESTQENIHEAA